MRRAISMNVMQAIRARRAVRSYTGERVDRATIATLLHAAVQAPTAMHLEPWAFVVVQDPERLRRYSDRAKAMFVAAHDPHGELVRAPGVHRAGRHVELLGDPAFDVFYGAGTLVVICARPLSAFVTADCWLAAENLMLAATAMGLGTCPIGFALPLLHDPEIKRELAIPPDVSAVAPIVVGVPAGPTATVSRSAPEILSWQ